jgi:glutathione peroxidase
MRSPIAVCAGLLALLLLTSTSWAENEGDSKVPDVLNFKMQGLDGKEVDLSRYAGKVVLFVNVASRCGYTPQYEGLEALHEKYGNEGLVIIGVPSNDFGKQEPGTNEQIATFCESKYGVKFPMLAKVAVKGTAQVPLYRYLTSNETDPKYHGPIKWNFTKFLIGRSGEIVARFESNVAPQSPEIVKAIEAELATK